MIDMKSVGKLISARRQEKGMTQQALAAYLNVTHQAVSKWENGAAVPDIDSLTELARLFGLTMEQLLNGDSGMNEGTGTIPEDGAEAEEETAEDGDTPSDGFDRILEMAPHMSPEALEEAVDAWEGTCTQEQFDAIAPFLGKDALDRLLQRTEKAEGERSADTIKRLISLAPFLSREALEEALDPVADKLSPNQLASLAPFLSQEYLEKLIARSAEINWDTLRRLAPFLKRETVSALAVAYSKSKRYVGPTIKAVKKLSRKGEKTLGEAIDAIGEVADGLGKAARNLFCPPESEYTPDPQPARPDPKLIVFRRALQEERFDWIGAHIDDLKDEELRSEISSKAKENGLTDWIRKYMPEESRRVSLEEAVNGGFWSIAAEFLPDAEEEDLVRTAVAAVQAEQWNWIGDNISEFTDSTVALERITNGAVEAGKWDFLEAHLDDLDPAPAEAADLLRKAAEISEDTLHRIADAMNDDTLDESALLLADEDALPLAVSLRELLSRDACETLLAKATEAGNWDLIEQLYEAL